MTALPTVHLGGTDRQTLIDGYVDARHAVADAIKALSKVEFNARDYCTQDGEAWFYALQEREAQFRHLRAIEQQLVDIVIWLTDTGRNA